MTCSLYHFSALVQVVVQVLVKERQQDVVIRVKRQEQVMDVLSLGLKVVKPL